MPGYQSGFGNEFATEAVAGALPMGQNAPQQVPLGLYAEQLSGTAFTAPRALNRRTWVYRIRPSVMHKPYRQIANGLLRSTPFDEVPAPPNQLRWNPVPIPDKPTDFLAGLITLAGNGDLATHSGVAIHVYAANRSMEALYCYNADGELLLVPQMGRLLLHTELGRIVLAPGEIAVSAARHQVSRGTAGWRSPRLCMRELWRELSSAGAWDPSGRTALRIRAIFRLRLRPLKTLRAASA